MSPLYKKVSQWVGGTHLSLILLALVVSLVSCEEEVETLTSLQPPPPSPDPQVEPEQEEEPMDRRLAMDLDYTNLILLPEAALNARRHKPSEDPLPEPKPEPEPEPDPEPEPEPEPAPERMTYEEHVERFGRPQPREQQTAPPPRPVEVPDIRVDHSDLNNILTESQSDRVASLSQAQQRAVLSYGDALSARLNAAWLRPPSLSGRNLSATVSFRVTRSGQLVDARIVRSSGQALFDRSILEVFRTIGRVDPPPAQAARPYQIVFRNTLQP